MVSTPMKLSNLLAHCLLGLVDCSSSLVLPKAKNSIPVQIFCSNIYSKFIKHRLWRRGSDLEKKLEIILQSYPLCCCLTWPPAPPMHYGTDHLLQPDTQPYRLFLWKDFKSFGENHLGRAQLWMLWPFSAPRAHWNLYSSHQGDHTKKWPFTKFRNKIPRN